MCIIFFLSRYLEMMLFWFFGLYVFIYLLVLEIFNSLDIVN